jgi:2'-5' RNA ligase
VSTRRCFVALELPPDVVDGLLGAGEALRTAEPTWVAEKWVAPANLHVTLKFLGNLDDAGVSSLSERLAAACAHTQAFELRLAEVCASPRAQKATMVWARFADDPPGSCARLARAVDAAAVSIGLPPERRKFVAHATLARARKPRRMGSEALTCANETGPASRISMSVLSATLFASTLTRRGPVYEVIAHWGLGQGS